MREMDSDPKLECYKLSLLLNFREASSAINSYMPTPDFVEEQRQLSLECNRVFSRSSVLFSCNPDPDLLEQYRTELEDVETRMRRVDESLSYILKQKTALLELIRTMSELIENSDTDEEIQGFRHHVNDLLGGASATMQGTGFEAENPISERVIGIIELCIQGAERSSGLSPISSLE